MELENKHSFRTNYLEYCGILTAIPRHWKWWLKENGGPGHVRLIDQVINTTKVSSFIYWKIFKDRNVLLKHSYKWQEKVNLDITADDLVSTIRYGWKTTNSPKLCSFHYRIITWSIITNMHLFYYKISDSKLCTFCNQAEETVLHLFVHCKEGQHLIAWVVEVAGKIAHCRVNVQNVLLSQLHENLGHPTNTLILLYKYFVYIRRCKYKARYAHKRLYTVLPKYSKIQVLPGITSCRLVKDNKQAIELNNLLINNMPEGGYG